MTWQEGVLLGVLQGATEFLPVSSSGHLVMAQTLLGVEAPGVELEVVLHLATLLSVLVAYRGRVAQLVSGAARGDRAQFGYLGLLALATAPTAVVGLAFRDFLSALFEMPVVTGVALLCTGALLWTARGALRRAPAGGVGVGTALLVGVAQVAAIVPGVSRSGITTVAALWRGAAPGEAAAFSFLLSVPAVAGAAALELPGLLGELGLGDGGAAAPGALAGAALAACATGVTAIAIFRAMLRRRSLHRFAPYLWAVGALFLWSASAR